MDKTLANKIRYHYQESLKYRYLQLGEQLKRINWFGNGEFEKEMVRSIRSKRGHITRKLKILTI